LKPNFANAYCDCALIYEQYNLSEKAMEYYKMALQLQPDHLNSLHNITLLKQKMGQYDDIVEYFHRILQHEDSDAFDVHLDLANVLYKEMGNLNDALLHYEKALTYDNTHLEIYIRMGNILMELNRSNEALSYFDLAIQLDSQCLEAYIYVSSIHRDNDNFIEAIHAYEVILKLNPDCPEMYCNLVQCLQKVCDWSDYDSHIIKLKEIIDKQFNDDELTSLLPRDSLLFPLSLEAHKSIATDYAKRCVEKLKKSLKTLPLFVYPTSLTSSGGCLKIGFVSSNFGNHPVTTIMEFMSSIYNYQTKIICYSVSSNDNVPSW